MASILEPLNKSGKTYSSIHKDKTLHVAMIFNIEFDIHPNNNTPKSVYVQKFDVVEFLESLNKKEHFF
jgi:hypothetical protein